MEHSRLLFDYVRNNKFEDLIKLLEKDDSIDVNIRDENGNYLIMYAVINNRTSIIEFLLKRGARIDIYDQEGRSILYIPIKYSYNDIIKLLLIYNKSNIGVSLVDVKDKHENIPLHYALFFKNIYAIKLLLDSNSNCNVTDADGNNALHLAVYSRNYDIIALVLDTNVNINTRTLIGETALHIACNFQLDKVTRLLVEHKIDINTQDYTDEITSLIYAVNLSNKYIVIYLLEQNADPNIQDIIGNTAINYAIIDENYEILSYFIKNNDVPDKIQLNINIHNIGGKIAIHLLLEKNTLPSREMMEWFIFNSNLNIQDIYGITPLFLLCRRNLWQSYKSILVKKKLNILVKTIDNKQILDLINKADKADFMNMIVESYIYVLRHSTNIWTDEWENMCNKELFQNNLSSEDKSKLSKYIIIDTKESSDICYELVKHKLSMLLATDDTKKCATPSYPQKIDKKCIVIYDAPDIEYCNFTGISLEVLIGVIYLLQKYKYACSTISKNFMSNPELCAYYETIGVKTRTKCEFLNFEIVWVYKKLFFSDNFIQNFNMCRSNKTTRFIIIPLGIELKNGSHANYLIYDAKSNEIERFEPYGSSPPYQFNYNPKLLDDNLLTKFRGVDKTIQYIEPKMYLPKIGLQHFDIYTATVGREKNIGDPKGYCAIWSIWYTDMRLTYPDIDRKSLIKKLIKEIKYKNMSFRKLIRNYSYNIVKIRDDIFSTAGITINTWINDQYDEDTVKIIVEELTKLLNKSV